MAIVQSIVGYNVGDVVIRIAGAFNNMRVGDIDTIVNTYSHRSIRLQQYSRSANSIGDSGDCHDENNLRVIRRGDDVLVGYEDHFPELTTTAYLLGIDTIAPNTRPMVTVFVDDSSSELFDMLSEIFPNSRQETSAVSGLNVLKLYELADGGLCFHSARISSASAVDANTGLHLIPNSVYTIKNVDMQEFYNIVKAVIENHGSNIIRTPEDLTQ